MGSSIGSKRNVKIFILYLMENINYPLDYITLNDIIMQTDYVMYLDFAESFHEMLDGGLIEKFVVDGEELYMVTRQGRCVAQELNSDILSSILDKSLAAALRYLDFKKRNVTASCRSEKRPDGRYDLICSFTEQGEVLFSSTIIVDSLNRVERMKENFRDRPEVIYRGVVALLAGNVNFLFD